MCNPYWFWRNVLAFSREIIYSGVSGVVIINISLSTKNQFKKCSKMLKEFPVTSFRNNNNEFFRVFYVLYCSRLFRKKQGKSLNILIKKMWMVFFIDVLSNYMLVFRGTNDMYIYKKKLFLNQSFFENWNFENFLKEYARVFVPQSIMDVGSTLFKML